MQSRLGNYTIDYLNSEEYHHLKQEIFTQDNYYVEFENERPVIIDAGAHIGLATLYFKKLYPQAQITAIEPNPELFQVLEQNIEQNRLEDVITIPAALASSAGTTHLYRDKTPTKWWSTSSIHPGAWTGDQQSEEFETQTVTLNEITADFKTIDLLKVDIEGAEQQVLMASAATLKKTNHIFVEFHPVKNQNLLKLLDFLSQNFDLEVYQDGKAIPAVKARGLVLIEGIGKTTK